MNKKIENLETNDLAKKKIIMWLKNDSLSELQKFKNEFSKIKVLHESLKKECADLKNKYMGLLQKLVLSYAELENVRNLYQNILGENKFNKEFVDYYIESLDSLEKKYNELKKTVNNKENFVSQQYINCF